MLWKAQVANKLAINELYTQLKDTIQKMKIVSRKKLFTSMEQAQDTSILILANLTMIRKCSMFSTLSTT